MNKAIVLASLLLGASLHAEEEQQHSLWYYHPLHVGGQGVYLGSAKCHHLHPDIDMDRGNVTFNKTNSFVSMMVPFNRNNILFPQVQFNYVTFNWDQNQKFHETHFPYLTFDLLYYSTALEKWKWIMRFDYNLQIEHMSHPGQYSIYNGLFWGVYQIHRKWHYHIGALGYAGMESYNIYPIIGFDFTPNKKWFFQAVFPINYSVEYKISDWTFAIKGRPLKERLRAGKHDPQPRSIFSYSTLGSELNIRYERQFKIALEGYAGYSWSGHFYIKNAGGHHAEYVDVNGCFYGGASIDYGF